MEGLYQELLLRQADPVGLAAFTAMLAAGATPDQVAALIAGSSEYFQVRGHGTPVGFLQALYHDALHRDLDPTGQAAFAQALAQGATDAQVATAVFTSTEYRQDLVESYYESYLLRAPDTGGWAAFVQTMSNGTPDDHIIAEILGSDEYFALSRHM